MYLFTRVKIMHCLPSSLQLQQQDKHSKPEGQREKNSDEDTACSFLPSMWRKVAVVIPILLCFISLFVIYLHIRFPDIDPLLRFKCRFPLMNASSPVIVLLSAWRRWGLVRILYKKHGLSVKVKLKICEKWEKIDIYILNILALY